MCKIFNNYVVCCLLGHYLPNIADTILQANELNKEHYINLKGIALCNPRMLATFEYLAIPIYALENNLITSDRAVEIMSHWAECDATLKSTCDIYADNFNKTKCTYAISSDCDR